ncbi:MAG: undecaprenyldiphospho-muramoylpentapeptide beta-N-acetylglucosaminyltransferase [Natronospirillum sp.]|uniref:undecaprenyldiphospho-muramoylpentapeptide beta-N-acetylglucosaminyltransferase n=1 Tax=Natronospirillum sp. TaxID=2812955 RepID=UPI0025D0AA0F|nr:undecaprenyldiphospho-muramoylpentapeptide beta-N-acetylglucosaminyltransferase [Natronospirillum sp.]MCH8551335.1 undecaprenyldiphospho-muramoylpentapeptide beta-N-acetylglucosaminyltransferase [Natronospirillum sp.]
MNESGTQVLIMAGGTGGHVFPGLAVAEALQQKGYRVSWLGTARGIENDVVPAAGLTLHHLSVAGVRGRGPVTKLLAPFRLCYALLQAWRLLRRLRPAVVLGMGGFAAGPGGLAARMLRIPLVIHEQNAVAGTTNRWLARVAKRRLCAFAGALPDRFEPQVVGNPIRSQLVAVAPPDERGTGDHKPLRLLILGGSQGALAINQLVPEALADLPEAQRPEVRHQCGRRHEETTRQAYRKAEVTAEIQPFIDDMAEALCWADLVVARAGALTVSELSAVGVGSLLIPFPFAIDDHQTRNAERLVRVHAARLLPQSELTRDTLCAALQDSLRPTVLQTWARAARAAGQPDATGAVVAVLEDCMEIRQ